MTVSFTVLGKPFGKQRHRTTRRGHSYSPPANAEYEAKVADAAHSIPLLEGAVDLTILATFQTPKSWTKKKTAELEQLFTLKLQAFEIDEIKNSPNKALRSKLRRAKNAVEMNALASIIIAQELGLMPNE